MAEYASDWTDSLVDEFNRVDANRDGVVTPKECLASVAGSSTTPATATAAPVAPVASPAPSTASEPEASPAVAADPSGVSLAYVQYAQGVIAKYDKDGNKVLTSGEWSEMSKSPAVADTDGNGQVTADEYAVWISKQ